MIKQTDYIILQSEDVRYLEGMVSSRLAQDKGWTICGQLLRNGSKWIQPMCQMVREEPKIQPLREKHETETSKTNPETS